MELFYILVGAVMCKLCYEAGKDDGKREVTKSWDEL